MLKHYILQCIIFDTCPNTNVLSKTYSMYNTVLGHCPGVLQRSDASIPVDFDIHSKILLHSKKT